jgi:aminopeptidase 2
MEPAVHINEILPADVVPTHYDISISTDFDTLTFDGEQKVKLPKIFSSFHSIFSSHSQVTLNIVRATNKIVLNALGLTISKASVGTQQSESIEANEEGETASITFASAIGAPGEQVVLHLSFSGPLDPNMRGYYKSKREVDGKT